MEHYNFSLAVMVLTTAASALNLAAGPETLQVELLNKDGALAGTVTLTELNSGVKVEVDARGLKPGKHGFHIHQNAACVGPDFKSAGEHFGAKDHKHGYDAKGGPHRGDLPNLVADASGVARAEFVDEMVTLKSGPKSLFRDGGVSFIVHEGTDDYRTQPAGDSGDRVACAELKHANRRAASLR